MKRQVGYLAIFLSLSLIGIVSAGPVAAQYMGGNAGNAGGAPQQAPATPVPKIQEWFNHYDNIRRQAQMNPQEKAQSDAMMSKGLSIFMPGDDKAAMQGFLRTMIQRYDAAQAQLKGLPLYPETKELHIGYYQYFKSAAGIFNDYIAVQNNPLAADAQGNSIAAGLLTRKSNLEMLDQRNKAIDAGLRQQFGIAPYHYP
jgi:hypothetical protein